MDRITSYKLQTKRIYVFIDFMFEQFAVFAVIRYQHEKYYMYNKIKLRPT